VRIADRDGLDSPGAVDQQSDPTVQGKTETADLASQFVTDDLFRRDPAPKQTIDLLALGVRQPSQVALDF
jgi:hypothetical protein